MSRSSLPEKSSLNLPRGDLRSNLGPLFFLAGIFFLNFLSRIVLAPLLIMIERDLHLGHKEAGGLFLLISGGYSLALLGSGYLSSRIWHRKTILCSALSMGVVLLVLSLSQTVWGLRIWLLLLGLTAGIYLPSGMAALTALIRPRDWGKAMAVHELAPNIGFVAAPFLAEAFLRWGTWRGLMALLGALSLLLGIGYAFFGRGGHFYGEAPTPRVVGDLLKKPSFWIMIVLFSLGIGTSFGVYTMLPLYLIMERGLSRGWANSLVALSRISGIFVALIAGWFVDRLGVKKSLFSFLIITGALTILLGIPHSSWFLLFVFLQPMTAVCFFPAAFTAINQIGPAKSRNVAVSFAVPLGFLLGGGVVPALIGLAGERVSFSLGFILVGGVTLVCMPLIRHLRFSEEKAK